MSDKIYFGHPDTIFILNPDIKGPDGIAGLRTQKPWISAYNSFEQALAQGIVYAMNKEHPHMKVQEARFVAGSLHVYCGYSRVSREDIRRVISKIDVINLYELPRYDRNVVWKVIHSGESELKTFKTQWEIDCTKICPVPIVPELYLVDKEIIVH